MNVKRSSIPNDQLEIDDIDLVILNLEQKFDIAIVMHKLEAMKGC